MTKNTAGYDGKIPIWENRDGIKIHIENLTTMHITNILNWLVRNEAWIRDTEAKHNALITDTCDMVDYDFMYVKIAAWREALNNELTRRQTREQDTPQ